MGRKNGVATARPVVKKALAEIDDAVKAALAPIKLDIGCGPNPRAGFEGVDQYDFGGKVKHVMDVRKAWPWRDSSVGEIVASHFIEHLTAVERIHFMNEAYRVLVPAGKMSIIVPHWCSSRSYGDPTHQWPPVSEMYFFYLLKSWRDTNAPHTDASVWKAGFTCDFDATWGYGMRPDVAQRNQEYQTFAMGNYKEVCLDTHASLTSRKK